MSNVRKLHPEQPSERRLVFAGIIIKRGGRPIHTAFLGPSTPTLAQWRAMQLGRAFIRHPSARPL